MSGSEKLPIVDIQGYEQVQQPKDYLKFNKILNAAKMEIQGRRSSQEDRARVTSLPGFQDLSPEEQDQVLRATFDDMQKRFGTLEAAGGAGSTACVATAWIDKDNKLQAKSANQGDGTVDIIIVDEDKIIYKKRINKILHNGKEPSEVDRIVNTGRFVARDKVNAVLAVTRSVGDPMTLNHDSDHITDIDTLTNKDQSSGIKLLPGQKAFMVVACDGLTEENLNTDSIAEHVFKNQTSPVNAAQALVKAAFEGGSKDNISVVVVPITSNEPVSAAVFDGHGGSTVAANLGKYFYKKLKELLLSFVPAQKQQEPQEPQEQPQQRRKTNHQQIPKWLLQQKEIIITFEEVSDFDGTMTAMDGYAAVNSGWFKDLLVNPNDNYTSKLKPLPDMVESLRKNMHAKDTKKERHPARITLGALTFLRKVVFAHDNVHLTICTKNRSDYVKAQLLLEGFKLEEIEKKIQIKEYCDPESRKNTVLDSVKTPGVKTRFHDDDWTPIGLIQQSVEHGGFTAKKITEQYTENYSNDGRIVLKWHNTVEDIQGDAWLVETEELQKELQKELLRQSLSNYVERIKSHKNKSGETDFENGFGIFFRETRARNRKANLHLAEKLQQQLDKDDVNKVISAENIKKLREDKICKLTVTGMFSTSTLHDILEDARQPEKHIKIRLKS